MSAYRNLVDGFLHLLGVNVERQGLPGVEQIASARGLFDASRTTANSSASATTGCPATRAIWARTFRYTSTVSARTLDAASIAVATGSTCWAAGSAGRIAALMPLTRGFDNLFIAADDDFAGRRALQRAREIRPDVVHLKFANSADANETIRQSGADTITASIDASFNGERAAVTSHLKDAA